LDSEHVPVLYEETLSALDPHSGGRYVDATVNGGGHAEGILRRSSPDGRLLGFDADPAAVAAAQLRLEPFGDRVVLVNENYVSMAQVATTLGFSPVDGVLFDLGLSSRQLAAVERGFSFSGEGPLDMRFNPTTGETAADLVNTLSEEELAKLFYEYGEEPRSRALARAIVAARQRAPITTTTGLVEIVERIIPRGRGHIHPATRAFQALRIAVNHELDNLVSALRQALDALAPQGRLAVIAFHSLEDRIVKRFMVEESRGCICPPRLPVCACGHKPRLELISRKAIVASPEEISRNPRSRSARLRVAARLEVGG
jgi:16S rRNA (cytosine1402-N4)-methyltransferase